MLAPHSQEYFLNQNIIISEDLTDASGPDSQNESPYLDCVSRKPPQPYPTSSCAPPRLMSIKLTTPTGILPIRNEDGRKKGYSTVYFRQHMSAPETQS